MLLSGAAVRGRSRHARSSRADAAHRRAHGARPADDPENRRLAAFLQALQQLGWTDGRNVRIDIRWAAGNPDTIRKYAAELVALAPDVILAPGSSAWRICCSDSHGPDRFPDVVDPVGAGFVESLSRPGGNATGFFIFEYASSGKWLELLKEIAPGVTRVAVLRDAANLPGSASSPRSRPWRHRSGWR